MEAQERAAEEEERNRKMVEKALAEANRREMAQQLVASCGFQMMLEERHAIKALELHRDNANNAGTEHQQTGRPPPISLPENEREFETWRTC